MAPDSHSVELLAERLNAAPPVFRGCTASELLVIVLAAAAVWLPLGLIGGLLCGAWTLGLGVAVVAWVGTVFVVPTGFQWLKRGKPEGHYQIQWRIAAQRWGIPLIPCDYILRGGVWDTQRGP